jgi:hypothetical protein
MLTSDEARRIAAETQKLPAAFSGPARGLRRRVRHDLSPMTLLLAHSVLRNSSGVFDTFDDAHVALRGIAQDSECGPVGGAVVGSNRLREAVELDHYGALIDPALISLGGAASGEVAPAAGEDGRNGKLGVFAACSGVGDRAIADDLEFFFPPDQRGQPAPDKTGRILKETPISR